MASIDRIASDSWWKVLAVGVVTLGLFAVVTTTTGELPDDGWLVGMGVLAFALLAIVFGLALGVLNLLGRRSTTT